MFESGIPRRFTVRYLATTIQLRRCSESILERHRTFLTHLPYAVFEVKKAQRVIGQSYVRGS